MGFFYGTFANWVELFQLAKAFDMVNFVGEKSRFEGKCWKIVYEKCINLELLQN